MSLELWVVFVIATPIVVLGLGWAAGVHRLGRRAVLSIPAFVIWTASVPYSAWEKSGLFNDATMGVIALAVLALAAVVFAPVADKVVGDG